MRDLIAIKSVSQNEEEAALYLSPLLEKMGFSVTVKTLEGRSTNLVGVKSGRSARKLLLGGHIDVVEPGGGWSSDPYALTQIGGHLYGRGVLDMKGGLACQIAVLESLYEEGRLDNADIELVGLCDEERYSIGAIDYAKDLQAGGRRLPNFGVFAEPHFDEIVIGATGKILLELTVHGKSGHAAHPESGVNAIENMAAFLSAVSNRYVPLYERGKAGSCAVLKIDSPYAGYSLNIPDRCTCLLSKQLMPGESKERFLDDLKNIFRTIAAGRLEIKQQIPSYDSYKLDQYNADIILLASLAEKARGERIPLVINQSVSDANVMWGMLGVPVVLYGLKGKYLHEADEYVEESSIGEYIEDMKAFIPAFFEETGLEEEIDGCL